MNPVLEMRYSKTAVASHPNVNRRGTSIRMCEAGSMTMTLRDQIRAKLAHLTLLVHWAGFRRFTGMCGWWCFADHRCGQDASVSLFHIMTHCADGSTASKLEKPGYLNLEDVGQLTVGINGTI